MKAKVLSLLLALSALPAFSLDLPLVWRETFDDNAKKWATGENEAVKVELAGGVYRISSKLESGNLQAYPLSFDRSKPYILEATLAHQGESLDTNVGFIWDFVDSGNFQALVISPRGGWMILRLKDGEASAASPWREGANLKKGKEYNTLTVEREASGFSFLANGYYLGTASVESLGGGGIGFLAMGKETVAVEGVSLAHALEVKGSYRPLTDNEEAIFSSSFGKDDAIWLLATTNIKGRFDSSDRGDSGYRLEHTGTALDVSTHAFSWDQSQDFSILATLKKRSGSDDARYGLVLDRKGGECLVFAVSARGQYSISRYAGGKRVDLVPWTENGAVKRFDDENTFGVYRRGDALVFALNSTKVHEAPWEAWTSSEVGFSMYGNAIVSPESLQILRAVRKKGAITGSCVDGFGYKVFDDGSRYVGSWAGGKPEGLGTWYRADGRVEEGLWKAGVLQAGPLPSAGPLQYPIKTKAGEWGLVDAKGQAPSFGLSIVAHPNRPVAGPRLTRSDSRIGFAGAAGETIASTSWSLWTGFTEGRALASGVKGGGLPDNVGSLGVLDDKGRVVVPPQTYSFNYSQRFDFGVIPFRELESGYGNCGIMGRDGLVVLPPTFSDMYEFSEGLAFVKKGDNPTDGYVDRTGTMTIKTFNLENGSFHDGYAYYRNLGDEGFIDRAGKAVVRLPRGSLSKEAVGQYIGDFHEGLVPFFDAAGKSGYLDTTGAVAIKPAWDKTGDFSEGLAAVNLGGKPAGSSSKELIGGWGYIDRTGAPAIPATLELADSFSNGLAAVRKDGLWGYIDKAGKWVVKPAYLEAYPFRPEGLAQVLLPDGSLTWIDRKGVPIWKE